MSKKGIPLSDLHKFHISQANKGRRFSINTEFKKGHKGYRQKMSKEKRKEKQKRYYLSHRDELIIKYRLRYKEKYARDKLKLKNHQLKQNLE